MNLPDLVFNCEGFDWDKNNLSKNREKHDVVFGECEEIFFNQPLLIAVDEKHSEREERFYALGKTDRERYLFAVFTIRNKRIRIISARDMSRKEREGYKNAEEKNTHL
jgi:uncharacterized protein